MANIEIKEVLDTGNDVLVVRGMVDGIAVEARGWLSAMSNHFDADDYEDAELERQGTKSVEGAHAGRRLKESATPREMTSQEKRDYCAALLLEAAPGAKAEPKSIALS